MTPDQARAIDQEEFEADCRRVRERAAEHIAQRSSERDERVRAWLGRSAPPGNLFVPPPAPLKARRASSPRTKRANSLRAAAGAKITLTYRGVTKTLPQWGSVLGISPRTLYSRVKYGWPVERVLTEPAQIKPGVASDFVDVSATGAPSNAQHFSQLEISE